MSETHHPSIKPIPKHLSKSCVVMSISDIDDMCCSTLWRIRDEMIHREKNNVRGGYYTQDDWLIHLDIDELNRLENYFNQISFMLVGKNRLEDHLKARGIK